MIQLTRLENETEVLMEAVENTNVVSIGFWIKTGSRDESSDQAGFSHFLEHMLFKGTSKRNSMDIAKEIDRLGGVINAYTEHEVCCYYCTLPYFHLEKAVDVLSDILTDSLLDKTEIEKEKSVVIHEIISGYDNPEELGFDYYLSDFWGDHPLGRKITAEVEQVKKIEQQNLLKFYKENYLPQNLIISVAGKFDQVEIIKWLEDKLVFNKIKVHIEKREKPVRQSRWRFAKDKFEQVHIYTGLQMQGIDTINEYYLFLVFSTLFGESMSSRLFQNIREKFGFCYSIYSFRSNFTDTSLLTIYGCTSPEYYIPLLQSIEKELQLLKTDSLSAKEIEDAKSHLRGGLLMFMEDMESRMKRLFRIYHKTGSLLEFETSLSLLDSIDWDDVNLLISRNIKKENFNLLAYGCARIKKFDKFSFNF